MSLSVALYAIVEADETYQKHLAVYEACMTAGVEVPDETEEYLGWDAPPNPDGREVQLPLTEAEGIHPQCGGTFALADLPVGTKYLKVEMS